MVQKVIKLEDVHPSPYQRRRYVDSTQVTPLAQTLAQTWIDQLVAYDKQERQGGPGFISL